MIWVATSYAGFGGLAALAAGITITAVTGLLMMSRFAYVSFKDVNPGRRVRFAQLLLIPLVITFAGVAVAAPGQMADAVSPAQVTFVRSNAALMERFSAANEALENSN